jgi:hypothetical protein
VCAWQNLLYELACPLKHHCNRFVSFTFTSACVSLLMLVCDLAAIVVFGLQILENGSLPGITG